MRGVMNASRSNGSCSQLCRLLSGLSVIIVHLIVANFTTDFWFRTVHILPSWAVFRAFLYGVVFALLTRSSIHLHRHPQVSPLRHRRDHQPHTGLRFTYSHAGRTLRRRYRRVAECLRRTHRPAVHPRSRGLNPSYRCPVCPTTSSHPVVHRQTLLQAGSTTPERRWKPSPSSYETRRT